MFLEVTRGDGEKILVNINRIELVGPAEAEIRKSTAVQIQTALDLNSGSKILIKEKYEEVRYILSRRSSIAVVSSKHKE